MTLKIYELIHPQTGEIKTVYEYPLCYINMGSFKLSDGQKLISDEPLKLPVRVVCDDYLKEMVNQREIVGDIFCDLTLQRFIQ